MHVVATAGHVDHGKSTLVRALTGQDPDRLAEERRRGLSIELGYCWTDLPGAGAVAFVDVPGHERFVATTIAGLGPVPVVMLVVAADDPWMPQAAEHLAAIDALEIRHGLLVVTRSDLADPAPVLAAARAQMASTSLRDAPSVVVSGRTGKGIGDLRQTLVEVLDTVPPPSPVDDVRLWVDRRFHVKGAGSVVTGTLAAGSIAVGDVLSAGEESVRVRGLQSMDRPRTRVEGVARVAVNVAGPLPDDVGRGSTLTTPDAFRWTDVVDVRHRAGSLPRQPVLHLGTALVGVRVRPLGERNARLRLETALPLRVGDRALLRDPGSREIWGVEVLDPAPPPLRRRGSGAVRTALLESWDHTAAGELARRGVVRRSLLRRLRGPADADDLSPGTVVSGDWLVDPLRAHEVRERVGRQVVAAGPDGVPLAEAARRLGLPDPSIMDDLLPPSVELRGSRLMPSGVQEVPRALSEALDQLREHLAGAPFDAPSAETLTALGLGTAAQADLARRGHLLRLAENVVLLPGADDHAVRVLDGLSEPFTAGQARQALHTSRRVVLPLLAHLDRTGRTVRLADDTRRLRRASPPRVSVEDWSSRTETRPNEPGR